MVASTSDAKVDFVLQQVEKMVGTEGGSLDLVSADEASLEVQYIPGVNEGCPECVPTCEDVSMFLNAALKIHASHISSVHVD